jgi:hypothetical protein
MYLVGARFDDLDAARAALVELRELVQLEDEDVGLRPLGSLRYEQPAHGLVLAGRFQLTDVDGVVEVMHRHGGEIVFKRPEWRTARPHSRGSDRACGRGQLLTRLRR